MPYHVRITLTKRRYDDIWVLDKDAEWIEQHVVGPHQRGDRIFISGRTISWNRVDQVTLFETARKAGSKIYPDDYAVNKGDDVAERFITEPPGQASPVENPGYR